MGVKAGEVINKLIAMGLMVTINQAIDFDTATLIATDFGYQVESAQSEGEETLPKIESSPENLKPRAPVVTIMGHVDHGKTSLLDAIRETHVIDGEAGGITQAIGAYHVRIKGREIVFLDTPGHEAFTAMRARGAQVTDIVVLVVAADDGVMGQTVEAINHARVADVPIIVAINKIDKPGADPGKIRQALTEYNLLSEEWGGETIFCEVSAKKKQGIEELLEMILLQADVMELKADPTLPARGVIIEAKLDRGRGPVATVLIQEGTLREGDAFVSKTEFGRVRAMINDQGRRISEAGPSMPVEVIGFSRVPQVSTEFVSVEDEKKARNIGEYWIRKERERELSASSKITLEQLYQKMPRPRQQCCCRAGWLDRAGTPSPMTVVGSRWNERGENGARAADVEGVGADRLHRARHRVPADRRSLRPGCVRVAGSARCRWQGCIANPVRAALRALPPDGNHDRPSLLRGMAIVASHSVC